MVEPSISDHQFECFLQQGQLMGSQCVQCGSLFVPPRPVCTECQSTELNWQAVQGEGSIVALTSIAIGPPAMMELGYGRDNPYVSAVIELSQGPRVVARVDGVDARHPETIELGSKVRISFPENRTSGGLVFEPPAT